MVFLKKFDTVPINKKVKGHKVNEYLWHVFIFGGWRSVGREDVIE